MILSINLYLNLWKVWQIAAYIRHALFKCDKMELCNESLPQKPKIYIFHVILQFHIDSVFINSNMSVLFHPILNNRPIVCRAHSKQLLIAPWLNCLQKNILVTSVWFWSFSFGAIDMTCSDTVWYTCMVLRCGGFSSYSIDCENWPDSLCSSYMKECIQYDFWDCNVIPLEHLFCINCQICLHLALARLASVLS